MGAIDAWAQVPTERMAAAPWMETLLRWTKRSGQALVSTTPMLTASMDAAGVDLALISAWHGPQGSLISNDEVEAQIEEAPDRLRGLATVDLGDPAEAVREIRRRMDGGLFVGVRVVPWLWDLPPNDRRYYPVYVACIEAGVPFCTQIGHTGPLCRSEPGRLIPYLDDVLLDLPELVVVGGHVGFPWIDEVVSLAHKYPNFFVDTSAYTVKRLPPSFVGFMRGAGRDRVLFGTNWPMIPHARCLEGLEDLGLGEAGRSAFLEGNARRIFGLSAGGAG
ncbi:MAG TPA: amidohydrolase [Deltaproteobacteria bacterium]|nr:amidohydrolase [Deltaproteobacteria bacterium]